MTAAGAGSVGAIIACAPGALAEPVENPCRLGVTLLCHFVPMAPAWEGDIDLTRDLAPADPGLLSPDERKPADYCFNGCI